MKKHQMKRLAASLLALCLLVGLLPMTALAVDPPSGYTTDTNGKMAYEIKDGSIDVMGYYNNAWIKTTYSNAGYKFADYGLDGADITPAARFINGGSYVQLSYTVEAVDSDITDGKLAVHADTQIGGNDDAAIEVIRDTSGQVIGLKMVDDNSSSSSYKAQFNLYFDGAYGVVPVTTYWFGYYRNRSNHYYDSLNDDTKSDSGTYEQENGVYIKYSNDDSGFAISWQNISIREGQSKTFSFIVGVGEAATPPQWDSENAVNLSMAAEVEGNQRLVDVSAKVKDAANLTDTLYYSVDGGTEQRLCEVTANGEMQDMTGRLDLRSYAPGRYVFSFWVVNSNGAASTAVYWTANITDEGVTLTPGVVEQPDDGDDDGDEPEQPTLPPILPGIIAGGGASQMQHFVDVTSMDYYFDAVQWAVEHGITTGTGKVTFSPDAPCTRAQAVTFLWRAMGSRRAENAANFTDVKFGSYYADAVAWAVENGITVGTSDTTFSPDAPCTRAQIVTFLYRAIGVKSATEAGFSDVPANAYYADAVNWAAQYGITGGTGANKFSPNATCTRAQIVTFLYRAK